VSFVGRVRRGAGLHAADSREVVERLFGGMLEADGGEPWRFSHERSLTLPAVFKAVRLFSEPSGAMPLFPYRRLEDGSRERATSHPSYQLLHDKPNPGQDAVAFWTLIFLHLATWGKAFVGKEFVGGRVTALHALEPWRVWIERRGDGSLIFHENQVGGGSREWTQAEVLYIPLFTLNGYFALSPIGLGRETMEMGAAMRRHGLTTFDESAIPAGAISTEQEIKDPDARERIRAEWKERHQRKRDIAILDAGAEFKTYTMPFDDMQFVELSGANRTDIADFFNIPASMLSGKTADSLTYGNRQDDVQQFLTFTLHNPLRKVEQALSNDRDLFPQVNTFFCEFERTSLLQPNTAARAAYYRLALDPKTGWMNRAEVRALENLPTEIYPPTTPAEEEPATPDTPPTRKEEV
jgi:HK97 family phage portal protein